MADNHEEMSDVQDGFMVKELKTGTQEGIENSEVVLAETPDGLTTETNTENRDEVQFDRYEMKHSTIGKAIIINNMTFHNGWPDRPGTDADAKMLKRTFENLGFVPDIKNDQTKAQMVETIKKIAEESHAEYDCMVIAILTHGEQDGGTDVLVGVDGGCISLPDLMQPLKDPTLEMKNHLAGKPKLIFVQACRGTKVDPGQKCYNIQTEFAIKATKPDGDGSKPEYPESLKIHIPVEADFLYHFSTASGFFAWRSTLTGAVFVQTLCEVLNKYADGQTDLMTMLTCVNRKVAEDYESACKDRCMSGKKQMPVIQSQLRKCIFFKKVLQINK